MYEVYGIPNCQTVKKATDWLQRHHVPFRFHDYKKEGIDREKLASWCRQRGWNELLNKKGTTWRGLEAAEQEKLKTARSAVSLMNKHTSLIKRPVIEKDGQVLAIGFDESLYQSLFK